MKTKRKIHGLMSKNLSKLIVFIILICSLAVVHYRQKISPMIQQPLDQANSSEEESAAPVPTIIHSCQRTGCMAAFESFSQFESYFDEILDLVEDFSSTSTVSPRIMEAVESGSESQSTSINVSLSVDAPIRPQHDENIIVS